MKKEIDAEVRRLRDIAQECWTKGDAESGKLAMRLTEIADHLEEIAACEEPQPVYYTPKEALDAITANPLMHGVNVACDPQVGVLQQLPAGVQFEKLRKQVKLCGLPAVYSHAPGLHVRTAIVPGSNDGSRPPKCLMLRVERGRNGTAAMFTVDGSAKFTLYGSRFCGVLNMGLAAADVWARRCRKETLKAYARRRRAKAAGPLTPDEELADTVARQKEEGAV